MPLTMDLEEVLLRQAWSEADRWELAAVLPPSGITAALVLASRLPLATRLWLSIDLRLVSRAVLYGYAADVADRARALEAIAGRAVDGRSAYAVTVARAWLAGTATDADRRAARTRAKRAATAAPALSQPCAWACVHACAWGPAHSAQRACAQYPTDTAWQVARLSALV